MNKFFGLFFISFCNSVGDFRPPSYNVETTNQTTKVLIYLMFLFNVLLNCIILLNFVIALISNVYQEVVDSQLMLKYIQRTELNNEWLRFESIGRDVQFWKGDSGSAIAQVILINCNIEVADEDDVSGII